MDPETERLGGQRPLSSRPGIIRPSGSGCPGTVSRQGREAFTLLEVLVVIAIIALIAAILIPSVSAARWQARHLLCQTNLRTIALGWNTYLVCSGGKFLKSGPGLSNAQTNYGGQQGELAAYEGSKPLNRVLGLPLVTRTGAEIFRCPLDTGGGLALTSCFDFMGNSYVMNHLLVGPPGPPGLQKRPIDPPWIPPVFERVAELDVAEITTACKLLLVGDRGWYNAWESSFTEDDAIEWHLRKGHHNIAFMDAHVEFVKIQKGAWTTAAYTLIPFQECTRAPSQE